MAIKKFLTSVADVYAYDADDNILFTGKTLLDSSIEVSLGSVPVRGGRGNQLQYIYYHTAEMNFTVTDTQWNLAMLAETVGATLETGDYYHEESVAVVSASGTVSETPIAYEDIVYGWATSPAGQVQRITFTGSTFTVTTTEADGNWCVRYYTANLSEGKAFTIDANIIPAIVKLVMETQLNSADVTTNKIGIVQIIAPRVALSGAFSLSMTADGIGNTPLTGMALAYVPTAQDDACSVDSYYAKIVEVIDNSNWYDTVYALSVSGGAFSLTSGATKLLSVYAIGEDGISFKAPNSGLDFTSSASSIATVGLNTGLVTAVTAGSATISLETSENTESGSPVDTTVVVTVTS